MLLRCVAGARAHYSHFLVQAAAIMLDDYLYELGNEPSTASVKAPPTEEDEHATSSLATISEAWAAAARTCVSAHLAFSGRLREITRDILCGSFFKLRVIPVSPDLDRSQLGTQQTVVNSARMPVTTAPTAEGDWGFFIGIDDDDDHVVDLKPSNRRRLPTEIGRPLYR